MREELKSIGLIVDISTPLPLLFTTKFSSGRQFKNQLE